MAPLRSACPPRFTSDGKAISYVVLQRGIEYIWPQPLDGSAGRQLTNFKSEKIRDFRWSPEGKKLGLIRGHDDSDADVVLLRDTSH